MSEISVALPVYNGANFLREALDSVLTQDFSDFELVISDNRSTDETPDILEEYAARDRRIRVHRSETFLPQAENVNRAVELCTGPWVKLFCHDDLMSTGCLSRLNEAVKDGRISSVGLIGNRECWLFGNGFQYLPVSTNGDEIIYHQGTNFLKSSLAGHAEIGLPSLTTAMVRKQAWSDFGGFDSRFAHFDVFLWTRLLMTWDYLFVPEILTTNRIHEGQVAAGTRKNLISVRDHRLFWKEFLAENGNTLGLSWRTRARTRLKGLGTAGSNIALEILKGNFKSSFRLWFKLPVYWWPLVPLFTARSLRNEKKKFATLSTQVPSSMLYPG
jgi:glycosyltransferase involved in cell wall biosynthesis